MLIRALKHMQGKFDSLKAMKANEEQDRKKMKGKSCVKNNALLCYLHEFYVKCFLSVTINAQWSRTGALSFKTKIYGGTATATQIWQKKKYNWFSRLIIVVF